MLERVRPRRARRSWSTRLTTFAVPGLLVGVLSTGVAVAAWPQSETTAAQPAVTSQPRSAPVVRDDTADRTTRLLQNGRPSLTEQSAGTATASDAAQKSKAAKASAKKAAAKRAAANKASAKKAAAKKAAAKKAAAKKAAAKKAATFSPTAAQLKVIGHRYTRVALNVRTQPSNSADLVTVLKARSKLSVTKTTHSGWTLVITGGKGRWVHSQYLTVRKPEPATSKPASSKKATSDKVTSKSSSSGGGISMARCKSGSSMESGLKANAIKVHRAVCARFPSVKSYGGMRGGGGDSFHTSGRAVDIMIPSASVGRKIADWVKANHKRLGVSQVIYAQHIWTVQRGSEGWRSMSDRGNATANHYDHVHVSVY